MSDQNYNLDSSDTFGGQDQYSQQQDQPDPYAGQQDYSQGPSDAFGAQDPYAVEQGLEPPSQQQPSQSTQGSMGQGQMDNLRQEAQDQIDRTIDQYASKVPGGDQVSQKAKDAAASGLDQIEKEAENRMGNMGGNLGGLGNTLGGLFGGNKGGEGNQ